MKRIASWALLGLLMAVPAYAQVISQVKPGTATASLTTNTCTGTPLVQTGCVGLNLGGFKYAGIQLTGTWSGTITIEVSIDGVTWVSAWAVPSTGTQTAVATMTGNGVWYTTQLVGTQFRARFSTATSGTVVVTLRATL